MEKIFILPFRVWDKELKIMITDPKEFPAIFTLCQTTPERYSFMNYTGGSDSNGTKIYTGDIVEFIFALTSGLKHRIHGVAFFNKNIQGFSFEFKTEMFKLFPNPLPLEKVIIGHIYENITELSNIS